MWRWVRKVWDQMWIALRMSGASQLVLARSSIWVSCWMPPPRREAFAACCLAGGHVKKSREAECDASNINTAAGDPTRRAVYHGAARRLRCNTNERHGDEGD